MKTTMNNNHLKRQLIHYLSEQGVPADYDPWEAVKTQIGPKSMQHSRKGRSAKWMLNLGYAMLVVLLAGVIFFSTPQGRATAKSLWQFFH